MVWHISEHAAPADIKCAVDACSLRLLLLTTTTTYYCCLLVWVVYDKGAPGSSAPASSTEASASAQLAKKETGEELITAL